MKRATLLSIFISLVMFYSYFIHPSYALLYKIEGVVDAYFPIIAIYFVICTVVISKILAPIKGKIDIKTKLIFKSLILGTIHAFFVYNAFTNFISPILAFVFSFSGATLFYALILHNLPKLHDLKIAGYKKAICFAILISFLAHLQFFNNPLLLGGDETFYIGGPFRLAQFFSVRGDADTLTLRDFSFYEPLPTVAYTFVYSLFGFNQLGFRLLAFLFYLLAAVYAYKLGSLKSKKTGFITATLFLFTPSLFYTGWNAQATSALLFFVNSAMFYFFKYTRDGRNSDALYSAIFVITGILYKKLALICVPVFVSYLLLFKRKRIKKYLPSLLIILLATAPLFAITKITGYFSYGLVSPFSPAVGGPHDDTTDLPSRLAYYLTALPFQLTVPVFLLFCIGLMQLLNVNDYFKFSSTWVSVWYLFSTISLIQQPRYTLPFLTPILIFSSIPLVPLKKKAFATLFFALLIFTGGVCVNRSLNGDFERLSYVTTWSASSGTLPFEEVALFFDAVGAKKISGFHASYGFYIAKHSLSEFERIELPRTVTDAHELIDWMTKNEIEYFVFAPDKKFYRTSLISYDTHRTGIVDDILLNKDLFEFEEFSYNSNALWVLQPKTVN